MTGSSDSKKARARRRFRLVLWLGVASYLLGLLTGFLGSMSAGQGGLLVLAVAGLIVYLQRLWTQAGGHARAAGAPRSEG